MPFRIKLKSKKKGLRQHFSVRKFPRQIILDDWLDCCLLFYLRTFFPKVRSSSVSLNVSSFSVSFLSIQLMLFRCAPRSIGARQKPGKRTHPWRDRRLLRLSRHGPSISSSTRLAASGSSLFFFYSFISFLRYDYLNDECSQQIGIREFSLSYYLKVRAAAQALVV